MATTAVQKYQAIYFKNLQLLGFNAEDPLATILQDELHGPLSIVPGAKDALPTLLPFTEKTFSACHTHSAKYLELVIYFLLHCYKPELLRSHFFKNCWPVIDAKTQAKEFRLAAFKIFELIKKEEPFLGKSSFFVFRKSFLDDPKSER